MSTKLSERAAQQLRKRATLFAALGDETRLMLLMKLGDGAALSITQLTEYSTLTRQAITKHLNVLESAGLVRGVRQGRENLFELEPKPLAEAKLALEKISQQWDHALAKLKVFVEE